MLYGLPCASSPLLSAPLAPPPRAAPALPSAATLPRWRPTGGGAVGVDDDPPSHSDHLGVAIARRALRGPHGLLLQLVRHERRAGTLLSSQLRTCCVLCRVAVCSCHLVLSPHAVTSCCHLILSPYAITSFYHLIRLSPAVGATGDPSGAELAHAPLAHAEHKHERLVVGVALRLWRRLSRRRRADELSQFQTYREHDNGSTQDRECGDGDMPLGRAGVQNVRSTRTGAYEVVHSV